jgi:hypothetical protein
VNARIARKVIRRAHPALYSQAQVHRALRRQERRMLLHREHAAEWCRECETEAHAFTLAMSMDTGHYPWGRWKCLMQRAAEGTLTDEELVTLAKAAAWLGKSSPDR